MPEELQARSPVTGVEQAAGKHEAELLDARPSLKVCGAMRGLVQQRQDHTLVDGELLRLWEPAAALGAGAFPNKAVEYDATAADSRWLEGRSHSDADGRAAFHAHLSVEQPSAGATLPTLHTAGLPKPKVCSSLQRQGIPQPCCGYDNQPALARQPGASLSSCGLEQMAT